MFLLFYGLLLIALYLTVMVIIVTLKQDTSIGNFTWGGGVMLLALYTFLGTSTFLPRQILVTSLLIIWGLRLCIQLYTRYKKGADPRFLHWQQEQGFLWFLLKNIVWIVFMEGTLLLIMAYPGVLTNIRNAQLSTLTFLDYIGTLIWIIGFGIESISDYQLFIFRKNQTDKNSVLDSGLWYYSRHPNYFGEIVQWWGIFCIVVSVPFGWTTIIAPLTITILLLFFTGIPMLEKAMAQNSAYQEYKKHTSMLIPLPKR